MDYNDDIILAQNMRKRACAKYSKFTVGAVLLAKNGKRYTGCNIENNGIQSICAERVAFCKALSEGEREFERIFIMGGPQDGKEEKCMPCGYCRQFMQEYAGKDFKICIMYDGKIEEYTLENLLPFSFEM